MASKTEVTLFISFIIPFSLGCPVHRILHRGELQNNEPQSKDISATAVHAAPCALSGPIDQKKNDDWFTTCFKCCEDDRERKRRQAI
jgi:hypothetical protein